MGTSTNATLFWGIELGEENPLLTDKDEDSDDDDEFDETEEYARRTEGLEQPEEPFDNDDPKIREIYDKYWDKRNKIHKASGCEIGFHCSCDEPMYYVTVTESETTALRGCPEEVKSLEVGGWWEDKLREYCKVFGIEWQEPKWWLVSHWC